MADKRSHVIDFDDSPLIKYSPVASEVYNDIINSLKGSVLRAINRGRETTSNLTM